MNPGFRLIFNSLLLGVGLAMDAFSVSLANGLNEPCMKPRKMCGIALIFAVFQGMMPMIGWVCVHTIVHYFQAFEQLIPWIALFLLCWIGGKMLYDGIRNRVEGVVCHSISLSALLVQGVATSIDALSVGFTIADYDLASAVVSVLLIAAVTFLICFAGLAIGKKAGTKMAGKAGIFGGIILIFIGFEIFLTGIL